MYLAGAFMQRDLHCIQGAFSGNQTHDLAMLYCLSSIMSHR